MMKAKCINGEGWSTFTKGKTYDVVENKPARLVLINDCGIELGITLGIADFVLIPDEPAAPKSDWMRCDCDTFVNMVTGMTLTFFDNGYHHANISHIATPDNWCTATHDEADAFAALVGYDWPSAGKEM
jgi:hypothetical protein